VSSSQEARRDFIRTIQHTVREHAQRSAMTTTMTDTAAVGGVSSSSGVVVQSAHATTSSTASEVTSTSMSTTFGVTRRPESLTTQPGGSGQLRDPRYGRSSGAGDRCSMDVDERRHHSETAQQQRSRCLTLSDVSRSNLAEHGALMHQQLGSQSTLASDRGAGGARLLHTSHDPLHYSTIQAAAGSAAYGHHHRPSGDGPGSPIWKRRQHGGRAGTASQSPASNDEVGAGSHSDGGMDHHSGYAAAAPTSGTKQQRVTFRIPPSAYIETEDTDC